MYFVSRGHLSHDESHHSTPLTAGKLYCSIFYRARLIAHQFYTVGTENFKLFCSYDLELEPMTCICEPELYPVKTYLQTKNKLSTSRLLKVIVLQTYIHTDTIKNITMQLGRWQLPTISPHRF